MHPFNRATMGTTVTLALFGGLSDSSSGVIAADRHQQSQAFDKQLHRGTEEFYGIGSGNYALRQDEYIPPWRDPVTSTPTLSPTINPTALPTAFPTIQATLHPTISRTADPTANPTFNPTLNPTVNPTANPTVNPTAVPVPVVVTPVVDTPVVDTPVIETPAVDNTSTSVHDLAAISGSIFHMKVDEETGAEQTTCGVLPSIGKFVSEAIDIEYFLYVEDDGVSEEGSIQAMIDSTIEPQLHDAIVDVGMSCRAGDYLTAKHVMVNFTSGGNAMVGAQCLVDNTDGLIANATACYQVWAQVQATMWFSPSRRQRRLQGTTTPFGDREAFNLFTEWMEDAFDSLDVVVSNDENDVQFVKTSFNGYVNVNDFDGTTLDELTDVGTDITSAFMGTAFSQEDGGINLVFGLIAIIAGVMVFAFVILVVVVRRRRNRKALFAHARCVDELELDSKDDLPETADVVDDESLFREDRPLPEDLKVKLESADHDYRWVGEERTNPIFVATERNAEFLDHLDVLRRRREEEERLRQYESVML